MLQILRVPTAAPAVNVVPTPRLSGLAIAQNRSRALRVQQARAVLAGDAELGALTRAQIARLIRVSPSLLPNLDRTEYSARSTV
jgi:hypothetical protein